MLKIPESTIKQIQENVDIVAIVSQKLLLKKSGKNYYGLCPFHEEKTPSFTVSPEKQLFYCFGCGKGGNVFQFLMETEKLTFVEAVRKLSKYCDVKLTESLLTPNSKSFKKTFEKEKIYEALECAMHYYHNILLDGLLGKEALAYLFQRGLAVATIKEFCLGYAPFDLDISIFLQNKGFSTDVIKKTGLFSKGHDTFAGRIIFPIHDRDGKVCGFGGRALSDNIKPKYLNSKGTLVFEKSNILFNLHKSLPYIKKEGKVILFEGYMDVLSVWQHGIKFAVASLGTSFNFSQAKFFYDNIDVYLCYDADKAGKNATLRSIAILNKMPVNIKVVSLPNNLDPDEYINLYGKDAFLKQLVSFSLNPLDFKLQNIKEKFNLPKEEEKFLSIKKILYSLLELSPLEQEYCLKKLAVEYGLSYLDFKEELKKMQNKKGKKGVLSLKENKNKITNHNMNITSKENFFFKKFTLVEKAEQILLYYMLQSKKVAFWVKDTLGPKFYTATHAVLAAYIYSYYMDEETFDINNFINKLNDELLISRISQIALLNFPSKIDEKLLKDCILNIQQQFILDEIRNKQGELKRILQNKEFLKAAKLSQEITSLRKDFLTKKELLKGGI